MSIDNRESDISVNDTHHPLVWDETFNVGIDAIDTDHRSLFELARKLFDAIYFDIDKELLHDHIDELIKYTKEHFEREEVLMETTKNPHFEEHTDAHKKFISDLQKLLLLFEMGRIEKRSFLSAFVNQWLSHHVLGIDKATFGSKEVTADVTGKVEDALNQPDINSELSA